MSAETLLGAARSALSSPRLTSALATTGIAVGVFSFAIGRTLGQPALLAAIATLIALMALSLLARRDELAGLCKRAGLTLNERHFEQFCATAPYVEEMTGHLRRDLTFMDEPASVFQFGG